MILLLCVANDILSDHRSHIVLVAYRTESIDSDDVTFPTLRNDESFIGPSHVNTRGEIEKNLAFLLFSVLALL